MCTGTVVSVVSYSDGMCQSSSTALKRITAAQGRVTAHQRVRSVLSRTRGAGFAPAMPRRSNGGAIIISNMCWTMCSEKR